MQLDPHKQHEILAALETLKAFVEHLPVNKVCADCVYYVETEVTCSKFKQAIPEHIIKKGCKEWEFDTIPF